MPIRLRRDDSDEQVQKARSKVDEAINEMLEMLDRVERQAEQAREELDER